MIECGQNGAGDQPYPAAPLRGCRKKCNRVGGIAAISFKIMLDNTDVVESELIGLGSQPEALIEVKICGFFLRSDVREKIDACFHRGLA